jgi:hypothetical protein
MECKPDYDCSFRSSLIWPKQGCIQGNNYLGCNFCAAKVNVIFFYIIKKSSTLNRKIYFVVPRSDHFICFVVKTGLANLNF